MSGFGTETNIVYFLTQIALFVVNEKARDGVLSLFVCPGVGNRTPGKKKSN